MCGVQLRIERKKRATGYPECVPKPESHGSLTLMRRPLKSHVNTLLGCWLVSLPAAFDFMNIQNTCGARAARAPLALRSGFARWRIASGAFRGKASRSFGAAKNRLRSGAITSLPEDFRDGAPGTKLLGLKSGRECGRRRIQVPHIATAMK